MMKRTGVWILLLALGAGGCGPRVEAPTVAEVVRGDIQARVIFQGELEARQITRVSVGVQGSAVLTELIEEGAEVKAGDVLARFDATQIEQDLARLDNELVRARQELESLELAELPLEELELVARRTELEAELEAEARFLESARGLEERGLMSAAEIRQQERRVEAQRERLRQWEVRMDLTQRHVHAARLAKARSALEAATRQRDFAARQLELCEVRAPADGAVALTPLPVGGEYRTAYVGDTLFHNQVFLCLPDPASHVLRGFIGEAELAQVRPGRRVEAAALAFPDCRLTGQVETVGSMAQSRPDQPAWRKFFPVQIALDPLPLPLPVGLTVRAEIVAGEKTAALLIPREAVGWREGAAVVQRLDAEGRWAERVIEAGLANLTHLEVTAGLEEGDRVRVH
ncbi:MAG: hypothetical protein GX803_09115 [Lentisphaerae bacterium]|nr:hypothetical protein [Lentisphaerota bacterium]